MQCTSGRFNKRKMSQRTRWRRGPANIAMMALKGSKGLIHRLGDSLSADDQRIFRDAATESSRYMREEWKAWEQRARTQAQQAGNAIIDDFNRTFIDAMSAIHQKSLSDANVKQLVARMRQAE